MHKSCLCGIVISITPFVIPYLELVRVGESASDELFFELANRVLFGANLLNFFSRPEIRSSRYHNHLVG